MRVHSGEKPFVCAQCNYFCTTAGYISEFICEPTLVKSLIITNSVTIPSKRQQIWRGTRSFIQGKSLIITDSVTIPSKRQQIWRGTRSFIQGKSLIIANSVTIPSKGQQIWKGTRLFIQGKSLIIANSAHNAVTQVLDPFLSNNTLSDIQQQLTNFTLL